MMKFTAYKVYEASAGGGWRVPEAKALFSFHAEKVTYSVADKVFYAYIGNTRVAVIPLDEVDAVCPAERQGAREPIYRLCGTCANLI